MSFAAGCRCGPRRYVLDFPVLSVSYASHRLHCQTMTGSGFSLHAVVPISRFVIDESLEG